jgi:hypothetical protein
VSVGLKIYPNPVNEISVLNYRLEKTTRVTLEIYDNLGRKISTRLSRVQQKGDHSVRLLSDDLLLPGVYFAVIRTDEGISRGKFIVK